MAKNTPSPSTKLATYTDEALFYRDKNLVDDLIGKISFTDMMFYHRICKCVGEWFKTHHTSVR